MKALKSVFAVLLAVSLAFSFSACSGGDDDDGGSSSSNSNSSTSSTSTSSTTTDTQNAVELTLKFNANGGKMDGESTLLGLYYIEAKVKEGVEYKFSEISKRFSRDGYTLLGWSQTKKTASEDLTIADCDFIANGTAQFSSKNGTVFNFYAVWKKEAVASKVIVNLYANGGKYNGSSSLGILPDAVLEGKEGESYTLTSESARFTRIGYTLLGWSKSKKEPSSTLTASDCDVTTTGKVTFSGTIVNLYAVWKISQTSDTSNGVIADGSIEIKAGKYEYIKVTLNKTATISVAVTSNDTDKDLQMYLLDSGNFTKFQNGSKFQYYQNVSSDKGTYSCSGSTTVTAGTYYYVIKNKALMETHTVTRKITKK